jgi:hypothetical protein
MKVHKVKATAFPGTDYEEVYPPARRLYNQIKAQTKRQPYVRSTYFKKEKVFIELFWVHLNQKNRKERNQRLKYYACGIELLRTTRQQSTTKKNPNKSNELLHRFAGVTANGELFYIQVKENRRTKRKDLMSIFPAE